MERCTNKSSIFDEINGTKRTFYLYRWTRGYTSSDEGTGNGHLLCHVRHELRITRRYVTIKVGINGRFTCVVCNSPTRYSSNGHGDDDLKVDRHIMTI